MLSTSVLCIKRKKKRSYCIANAATVYCPSEEAGKRSNGGAVTMLQITEDTPADMLAGAMDLTVHLPNGRAVKMSVKRSMPMMDLLMHISTNNNLQLTDYTLQALSMAPSPNHMDRLLPFKPNTPIGLIDTQHIKVLPKQKTIFKHKPAPQPFESTFRLKVHLPMNQLYVTRVSRHKMLDEILSKACEEKNLDKNKYALHHPANLDEVLDPKLTLNDYQITEVYLVAKGTVNLHQTFSASDLVVLRKEEERKRMQQKTGGGVLNLIFGRNKSSMGSGSLSSDNRSISPSHSDDSRSVTPPAIPQQIITPPPKQETEKPKPPQRKRRPAPKPPTHIENPKSNESKPSSNISDNSDVQEKKTENSLTICHSRNSSDSSGYHEASILSDNCNTSLPRRPQSAFINGADVDLSKQHSQSTTNLSKMSSHSKSTSSLAFAGRKKKAAPPPPPVLKSSASVINLVAPSPVVVASQAPVPIPPAESQTNVPTPPKPLPRKRAPIPNRNRSSLQSCDEEELQRIEETEDNVECRNPRINSSLSMYTTDSTYEDYSESETRDLNSPKLETDKKIINEKEDKFPSYYHMDKELEIKTSDKIDNISLSLSKKKPEATKEEPRKSEEMENALIEQLVLHETQNLHTSPPVKTKESTKLKAARSMPNVTNINDNLRPPEIVGVIPKQGKAPSKFNTFTRKTCYNIGSSLIDDNFDTISNNSKRSIDSETSSVRSALNKFKFEDEINDFDDNLFTGSLSRQSEGARRFNQLYGMHGREPNEIGHSSLRSVKDVPRFDIKKWNNVETLDNISQTSYFDARNNMATGGSFDTESLPSTNFTQATQLDSLASHLALCDNNSVPETPKTEEAKSLATTPPIDPEPTQEKPKEEIKEEPKSEPEEIKIEDKIIKSAESEDVVDKPADLSKEPELEVKEIDWQYQLPPPPEGFRDNSSCVEATTNNVTYRTDSVVTSPELFEKLKVLEDNQSEPATVESNISEDEKPLMNSLSLENLEKRKSLVYNRELATSLKMTDDLSEKSETFSGSLSTFESTYEEIRRSSLTRDYSHAQAVKPQVNVKRSTSTLPNFKISSYNQPKKNIKVFEDESISSSTNNLNGVTTEKKSNLSRSYVGRSMENISFRKNSWGNQSDDDKSKTKENNYSIYRPQSSIISKSTLGSSMYRSESFSTDQHWSPSKPVSRSKSQLALNKYKDGKTSYTSLDTMTKSNSLLDVSGLQSVEVMKMIQNRLKTPTSSIENVSKQEKPIEKSVKPVEKIEQKPEPVRTYQYRPPSINLSTWSERPKVPVNVKDDTNYKTNNVSSKLIVNTTNNNITSNNRIEVNGTNRFSSNYTSNGSVNVRVGGYQPTEQKNVSIEVNGTEPILREKSGNVVIKIGGNQSNLENQRFISHATPAGYRKPLGNINKTQTPRPHSIAVDSDLSHVPVVRSVELKKPYKDINTSITHIYQGNNNNNNNIIKSATLNRNSFSSNNQTDKQNIYRSNENLSGEHKPVGRVNSFMSSITPVVRGFKSTTENNNNNNNVNNRLSWNPSSTNIYSVNKPKENESYSTNKDVPFSQSTLRRTESSKLINQEPKNQNGFESNDKFPSKVNFINQKNSNYNIYSVNKKQDTIQPPPPPQMPKFEVKKRPRQLEPKEDPRDLLLASIRNFGGKKGLKSVKG